MYNANELVIKELYDVDLITKFLTEPELWDRISEYGQNRDDFEIVLHDSIGWIGFYNVEELIGILFIHPVNSTTCIVHINIHKQNRALFSKEISKLVKAYLLTTEYKKFNTSVPSIYPDVQKFLERNGFIVEGIDRKSINKHDRVINQINYGITRNELEGL